LPIDKTFGFSLYRSEFGQVDHNQSIRKSTVFEQKNWLVGEQITQLLMELLNKNQYPLGVCQQYQIKMVQYKK